MKSGIFWVLFDDYANAINLFIGRKENDLECSQKLLHYLPQIDQKKGSGIWALSLHSRDVSASVTPSLMMEDKQKMKATLSLQKETRSLIRNVQPYM